MEIKKLLFAISCILFVMTSCSKESTDFTDSNINGAVVQTAAKSGDCVSSKDPFYISYETNKKNVSKVSIKVNPLFDGGGKFAPVILEEILLLAPIIDDEVVLVKPIEDDIIWWLVYDTVNKTTTKVRGTELTLRGSGKYEISAYIPIENHTDLSGPQVELIDLLIAIDDLDIQSAKSAVCSQPSLEKSALVAPVPIPIWNW